jgi:hypothetical protein
LKKGGFENVPPEGEAQEGTDGEREITCSTRQVNKFTRCGVKRRSTEQQQHDLNIEASTMPLND